MKTLCIFDHKGGVGKTTTAGAIAQGIKATRKRAKVLLIDADPQGSASNTVYGVNASKWTLYDVLRDRCTPADAILETEAGAILPYSRELALLDAELAKTAGKDFYIKKKVIEPLNGQFTHIIIDTAPGLITTTIQALTASDTVLIPIHSNAEGVEALQMSFDTIATVKEYNNPSLNVAGAVITQYDGRANVTRQYEELIRDVADGLDVPLLRTRIRRAVAIDEAHALRADLFTYAPRAKVTADYEALLKELKL